MPRYSHRSRTRRRSRGRFGPLFKLLCLLAVGVALTVGATVFFRVESVVISGNQRYTQEEILAAYYRAEEAYGWFDLAPLPSSGEAVRLTGAAYRRVDYPGMETMDDLRAYLRNLFSAELTDQLLSLGGSRPYYQDVDGALHVSFSGRDRDGSKGASQVEAVRIDGQAYSLEVSVELLDSTRTGVTGLECWSFSYAYVDGRWVFTDFQLVG